MIDDEGELHQRLAEKERRRKEEHDRQQFEELYAYYPGVVSFLKQLGFPHDEARELAQDVFVRVYQGIGDYRGEAKWSYLQRIARRLALNRIRDQHTAKRGGETVPEDQLDKESSDPKEQPDAIMERQEARRRYYHAVVQLDEKHRTCMLLYLAEFSYQEIGDILGISQPALKSRLVAARDRLKDLLGEEALRLGVGQ